MAKGKKMVETRKKIGKQTCRGCGKGLMCGHMAINIRLKHSKKERYQTDKVRAVLMFCQRHECVVLQRYLLNHADLLSPICTSRGDCSITVFNFCLEMYASGEFANLK